MFPQHLQKHGLILSTFRRDTTCPIKHVQGISCQGRHHKRHEVGILIVITMISDTTGPLPKGISHIMSMTLLAPKFRYLDLTRKSILFLLPPSRGESFIRVNTTPATSNFFCYHASYESTSQSYQ